MTFLEHKLQQSILSVFRIFSIFENVCQSFSAVCNCKDKFVPFSNLFLIKKGKFVTSPRRCVYACGCNERMHVMYVMCVCACPSVRILMKLY